jgi:hypothetical protein
LKEGGRIRRQEEEKARKKLWIRRVTRVEEKKRSFEMHMLQVESLIQALYTFSRHCTQ